MINNVDVLNSESKPEVMVHRGVVVDNNDPKKKKRVRVDIPGLYVSEGRPELLPWALPFGGVGFGSSENADSVHVPEIGSEVCVTFPDKNEQMPYYHIGIENHTVWKYFQDNYPDRHGFRDSKNNFDIYDRKDGHWTNNHKSGNISSVSDKGDEIGYVPGNFDKLVNGIAQLISKGSLNISSDGVLTISSSNSIVLNAPSVLVVANTTNMRTSLSVTRAVGAPGKVTNPIPDLNKSFPILAEEAGQLLPTFFNKTASTSGGAGTLDVAATSRLREAVTANTTVNVVGNATIGGIGFLGHRHGDVRSGDSSTSGPSN